MLQPRPSFLTFTLTALASLPLAACTFDTDIDADTYVNPFPSSGTGDAGEMDDDSGETGEMEDETGETGETGEMEEDTGETGEMEEDTGDEDQEEMVDLLLVIDNSMSMVDEQLMLQSALLGFFEQLGDDMSDVSFHVAAVSTGDIAFNLVDLSLEPCTPEGEAYSSFSGDQSLEVALELLCRTEVGLSVLASEAPIETTLGSLADAVDGGINEGFLRPDALLSVIFITDEDDDIIDGDGSLGEPADWAAALTELAMVEAGAEAVVAYLLMGPPEPNDCEAIELPDLNLEDELLIDAEPGLRLGAFAELMPGGLVGDICAPSYDDFFTDVSSDLAGLVAG